MARYTGEYTIPAGEWNAIEVQSDDGITVGSVAVDPVACFGWRVPGANDTVK